MEIISVKDLSFTYPTQPSSTPALRNIDLDVSEGECVAILGETGAGKSTLCLAMNGLVPQVVLGTFEGSVEVAGHNTTTSNVSELALVVGIMFQDPESQLVGMTVEEELFFGAGNYGTPREVIRERSKWALDLLRLSGYEKREPATLSGGEKQRVALTAVLVMKPQVLVLDEPTSELDPMGRSEVYQALRTLKRELGVTILITSHDTEEIASLADRVIVLRDGSIVENGSPDQVFQKVDKLQEWGVRPPQVVQLWNGLREKLYVDQTQAPILLGEAVEEFRSMIGGSIRLVPQVKDAVSNGTMNVSDVSAQESFIEVNEVRYSYPGGTEAVSGISFGIESGEYVAIIGQNGSGKTTLVKLFNGLLKPTDGHLKVNGHDTRSSRTSELAHTVAYCFQNPDHQIFRPTVWDEASFGPSNLGFEDDRLEYAVNRALGMVGLADSKDVYPFNLGKGERQKVALASVLAMEPQILIIDEPTTGLDWKTGSAVMELLNELNQDGHTIVVITHDMELVAEHVRRAIVLHQGRVLIDGSTGSVLSQISELKKTYLEPPQITQFAISLGDIGFPADTLTVKAALRVIQKEGK